MTRLRGEGTQLTERERLVVERVVLGDTNKQMANSLGCSVKTVEFHLSNVFKKLGVDSRLGLAVEVLRRAHVGLGLD